MLQEWFGGVELVGAGEDDGPARAQKLSYGPKLAINRLGS